MIQSRLTKNAKGYGYKYTDLAEINKLIEENGLSYYQFLVTEDGVDYVFTVKVDADGNEGKPIRGAKVVLGALSGGKTNPAQDYGSALTYARRYSLLMAYGLATTDDDAASLTVEKEQEPQESKKKQEAKKKQEPREPQEEDHSQDPVTDIELATLEALTKKAFPGTEIAKIFPTWPKLTKAQYVQATQTIRKKIDGSESENH